MMRSRICPSMASAISASCRTKRPASSSPTATRGPAASCRSTPMAAGSAICIPACTACTRCRKACARCAALHRHRCRARKSRSATASAACSRRQAPSSLRTSGDRPQETIIMAQAKSLEGKSIIVTGAGRGIGREIALLCATEGAKVVVNDPGGAADGSGTSATPAEEVVEEIRKRGGTAVANFETVAEAIPASRIVKMAVDSFGRLDGVVNNAGILRDMIFHRMSVEAFEAVIKVHLMGSFYVSHAAARLFREQESGAFVHFTSTSGLIGNFGQANYAAAKLGIVGLSKS